MSQIAVDDEADTGRDEGSDDRGAGGDRRREGWAVIALDHLPPKGLGEHGRIGGRRCRKTTQERRQHGTHLGKRTCEMAHESIRERQQPARHAGRIHECPHEHEEGHRQQRIGTGGAHDLLDEDLER